MKYRFSFSKDIVRSSKGSISQYIDNTTSSIVVLKKLYISDGDIGAHSNEARLLKLLHHDNIVRYYGDYYDYNDIYYSIILEYIDGTTLEQEISHLSNISQRPSKDYIYSLLYQQSLSLECLNFNRIVHNDIKPANIMYSSHFNQFKLCDFGLARQTDQLTCPTIDFTSRLDLRLLCDSPRYLSSELYNYL